MDETASSKKTASVMECSMKELTDDKGETFRSVDTGSYIQIQDGQDLSLLSVYTYLGYNTSGVTFVQTSDIDLQGQYIGTIGSWNEDDTRLCHAFSGIYDGSDYTISKVGIQQRDTYETILGLFGYTRSAILKHIQLDSITYRMAEDTEGILFYVGDPSAGQIVGRAVDSTITQCINRADLPESDIYSAAGIVYLMLENSIVNSCRAVQPV